MTRIIAGRAGGRRLMVPKGNRTRPTTDRTREALFSVLASWFGTQDDSVETQCLGLNVLDLFAGSGAVGLEAASRGAARVVAVESGRAAAALIVRNAASLGLTIQVEPRRVSKFLGAAPEPFDLVFADPPYDMSNDAIESFLNSLVVGWLNHDALVVIERPARSSAFEWPDGFADMWSRRYGETILYYATMQQLED